MHTNRWFVTFIFLSFLVCLHDIEEASAKNITEKLSKGMVEWVFPADGVISDLFSSREGTHKGLDIAGPAHSPIYSVEKGTVIKSYFSDTYGHVIFIEHPNGFQTVYAHLAKRLVKKGGRVEKGEMIGSMGNTGHSYGNHLHFEAHVGEWTLEKEYAFDPLLAFGGGLIGDRVFALETSVSNAVEAIAGHEVSQRKDKVYLVEKGDTVWSIAQKYNMTTEELKQLNKLDNSHFITVGQKLIVRN